jgi:hypothetical protein
VRENGRIVGGKEWQKKVYNREERKKLLRTARKCRRILRMPMEWMNEWSEDNHHLVETYSCAMCLTKHNKQLSWWPAKYLVVHTAQQSEQGWKKKEFTAEKLEFWVTHQHTPFTAHHCLSTKGS